MRFHRRNSEPARQRGIGTPSHPRRRGLSVLLLCFALCLTFAHLTQADTQATAPEPARHVLILHSYHQGLTWTDGEDEGIRKVLDEHPEILISTEYLDSKRFPLEAIETSFATFLTQKYHTASFDAVIATDNSALTFLSHRHSDLFPNTPIIFCGVNDYLPSMIDPFEGHASGVVQLMDPQGTLDLIRALQPDLRNLVVVSGITPTAQAIRNEVEKTLKQQKTPFQVVWINGPDTKTLRDRLAVLSPKDAVLLCNFNRDANQVYYSHEDGAKLIAQASNAPVYAMEDLYIGTGVLGGSMMSPVDQGTTAAKICIQALRSGNIPDVVTHPAVVTMIDYPVLTRFGWTPSDAPPNTLIANRPASFYDRYKTLIWQAAAVFCGLILALLAVSYALIRAYAAARAVRRSEENLSTTLNSIGDGVIATDLEGRVIRMNPVAEKLTGWPSADATGKPLSEVFNIINVRTREPAPDPVRHVIESGRKVGLANHTMLLAKDGAEYQIADSASPIRTDDETMTGVVLVFRDVTEEYRIQEELHQTVDSLQTSEQQRREAQEMAKLGHWNWNVKTGDVEWSEEVFRIFGLDPKTFKPQIDSIMALSPWPGDSQRHQELIDRAIKDRTRGHFEQRFLRPDGSIGYYASTFQGVYDDKSDLIAIKGVVQDITERKRAERRLLLTQRSVDQSKDTATWARMDGRIVYANDAACRNLGYSREELLKLSIPDIDSEWTSELWPANIAEVKREGAKKFTSYHRRKDGSVFPVEVVANYVEAEGEELVLAFATDITEQRRHEEQLLESESRFRELFDNMGSGVAVYRAVDDGADFVCVDYNRAGEKIDKCSKQDVLGKRITEVFPAVEAFGLLDVLRRVWKTGDAEQHPVALYLDRRIEGWRENFVYRLPSGEVVAVYNDVTERVRAEEERDRLFNHSIDMLCVAGFDGSFKQINPAFTRTLGWAEHELRARPWLEFVHPDDLDATMIVGEKLTKGIAIHAFENRYRCKDGSYRWLSWNSFPLVGQGQIFAVCRDITEQKEAAETLRQSEERYRLAQHLSGVGTWEWNVTTNEVYWSEEVVTMWGYKPGEFHGTYEEVAQRVHPDDYDLWQENVRACMEEGKEHDLEFRIVWPDGSVHWVVGFGNAERGKDGKAIRLVGVVVDITDRKNADQAARESEQRYREIFDSSRDGFVFVDADAHIIEANQAYCDMLGYSLQELQQLEGGFFTITPERWHKWEKEEILAKRLLTVGYSGLYKKEYIHKDGHVFPVELHSYARLDKDGKPESLWGIVRDITHREEAEKSLRESERSKAVLLANLPGMSYRCAFDRDWTMEFVSPGCKELTGWEVEDLLHNHTLSFNDLLVEDYREKMWEIWQVAVREHRRVQDEYEIITRDGNRKWVWEQGIPIYDDEGNVVALEGLILDVTDRKKAEQELEATTAFLDTIVNESPFSMWVARPDGTIVRTNRAVREALNLVDDQIINRYNVLQDENILKQGKGEAARAVFEEGKPARFNLDWRAAEVGDIEFAQAYDLHIDIAMFPILDAAGQVTHVVGQWVDITDRKRAEEGLQRLAAVVEHTRELISLATTDGKMVFLNEAGAAMLGIESDEIGNSSIFEILPEHMTDFVGQTLLPTLMNGHHWEGELQYRNLKNGSLTTCLAMCFPINDPTTGLPQLLANVSLDITDRVRAEEALKDSERLLRDVIQGTPVAAFVIGKDHKVLHWNRALAELSRIPEEEVLGTTDQWRAFYPGARPCLADVILDQNYEALETYYGGKFSDSPLIPEAYEATDFFPHMGEDGRWLRFTVALIRDAEGQPVGAVEMLVDITEQMRAEAALRDSEDKHRTLFETMAQGVLYRDAEGNVTDANPAALRILGVTFDELVDRTNYDARWQSIREDGSHLPGDEHPSIKALRTGRATHNQVMGIYNAENDSHRWLNVNAVPRFRPGEDKPYQVYTTLEDITERRREEQVTAAQLRLIEFASAHSTAELLQHFLDEAELLTGSKAGFYHFLEDDQETLSLQAWSTSTLSGMCTAEGAGRHYPISKAGVWVDCIRERKAVVHNDYQSLPHKKGLPPGHAPIIREVVVPVIRGDKIMAILGVGNKHIDYNLGDVKILQQLADLAWEVVVRKQAEEKLRDSEQRFRIIFEQAAVGVAVIATQTGRFARLNQRYADILGYSREEMRNISFQEITHPDDLPKDQENMQRMIRGETQEFSMEKRYYHKNGSIIWVNLFVSAMWNPGDTPEYHIAVVEDITERKHAEEELTRYRQHLEELVDARTHELEAAHVELIRRERLATLGRLTATVSHELRNPLGTIRGSLFTINRATQDRELGIERALDRAQRNIDRCDAIIGELLDYTRSTVPEPEPTRLDDWLAETLDEQSIPEGVSLVRSLQTGLELPLDREKLRRCVVNLVTNAYQAIQEKDPPEGQITVETERKDDRIEIRILDTGPGIDQDGQEKIFEPLYSTKGFGVGLGLSIVKQLIEAAGGGISITSTPGSGANAVLWLPLAGMKAPTHDAESTSV